VEVVVGLRGAVARRVVAVAREVSERIGDRGQTVGVVEAVDEGARVGIGAGLTAGESRERLRLEAGDAVAVAVVAGGLLLVVRGVARIRP
jgi:hypothetical protein